MPRPPRASDSATLEHPWTYHTAAKAPAGLTPDLTASRASTPNRGGGSEKSDASRALGALPVGPRGESDKKGVVAGHCGGWEQLGSGRVH